MVANRLPIVRLKSFSSPAMRDGNFLGVWLSTAYWLGTVVISPH